MNNIISVKDMCLWYGEHQALKNVNIEIPEKSITAFIGPSGCGKSTFLKTLNRMNDLIPGVKITGDIRYENADIFSKEVDVNHLRKEIGMVFQKPNPFPMSIYDNVAYGPRTHGITNKMKLDEIVENALRDAAIWDEVKDRLKNQAKEDGRTMQDELVTYGLERAIYRLSISEYAERFTLKGGIFLYALFDGNFARATTDIDLLAQHISNDAEAMKKVFHNIFSIECDDALRFDLDSLDVINIT